MSRLTKMIFPFLAFPIMAGSVYGDNKNLSEYLQPEQTLTKIELKSQNEQKSWLPDLPKIRLYFSGSTGSYHFDRDAGANEKNFIRGIGIPFKDTGISWIKEVEAFAYNCTNSEGNYSRARGVNLILGCTDTSLKVCGGFGVGGVDGYKSNDYKFELSKYPFPHLSLSYKQARFNAYISNVVIMYTFGLEF